MNNKFYFIYFATIRAWYKNINKLLDDWFKHNVATEHLPCK